MANYRCKACGYIYNVETEKIEFNKLSEKYKCPICGRKKSQFEISDEFTDENS